MRATIKMIAERAGVSIGTVDRVLHDRPYVKAEVRERILQVMEELDYRPNRMASALATSGTPRRFVVVQPAWKEYLGEAMAEGVAQFRKARRDYNLTVDVLEYPRNDMAACLRLLEQVEREGAQGIALSGFDCESVRRKLEELSQRRIPVVTFNSDIANAPRLCYVGENARRAGRTAGEIASKFYRPGDRMLLVYGGPEFAGRRGFWSGWKRWVSPGRCAAWPPPTMSTPRPWRQCPRPWNRSLPCIISIWPTSAFPPVWRQCAKRERPGRCASWPTISAPRSAPF